MEIARLLDGAPRSGARAFGRPSGVQCSKSKQREPARDEDHSGRPRDTLAAGSTFSASA
jgi:hypothetical protein